MFSTRQLLGGLRPPCCTSQDSEPNVRPNELFWPGFHALIENFYFILFFLNKTDGVMTTNGSLNVTLVPVAEYDNATGEFHVVLQCGTFIYPTRPPFDVVWQVGKTRSLTSASFNFSFQLKIILKSSQCGARNEAGEE